MIAVFWPVHTSVEVAYYQILNYRAMFGGNARFILHLSESARGERLRDYEAIASAHEEVEIVPFSWKTSPLCVFGAFLACGKYVDDNFDSKFFSHVYLHTDSDLLLKRGLSDYIASHHIGFGCGNKTISEEGRDKWGHAKFLHRDQTFKSIVSELSVSSRLFVGRQEGSFFTYSVWRCLFDLAKELFPWNDYLMSLHKVWPVEEVFIPTICRSILGITDNKRNVIHTKRGKYPGGKSKIENTIGLDEVLAFLKDSNAGVFGAKRWPLDINHEVRRYIDLEIAQSGFADKKMPWLV